MSELGQYIRHRRYSRVKEMIENGADPNAPDMYGVHPLNNCHEDPKMAILLKSYGSKIPTEQNPN